MSEGRKGALRVNFDGQLKLEDKTLDFDHLRAQLLKIGTKLSVMPDTLRFNWPRSPFPENYLKTFC